MASSPINKSLLANGGENNNLLLKTISRPSVHDFAALQAAFSAPGSALGKLQSNCGPLKPDNPASLPVTSQLQMTKQNQMTALSPGAPGLPPVSLGALPGQNHSLGHLAAAAAARNALGQLLKNHQNLMGSGMGGIANGGPGIPGRMPTSMGEGLVGPHQHHHLRPGVPCFCNTCTGLQKPSMHSLCSLPQQTSLGQQTSLPSPTMSTIGQPPPALIHLPLLHNPAGNFFQHHPGAPAMFPPVMSTGLYGAGPHSAIFDGSLHPSAAEWVALGRRKNATRETTAALKSWLQEHLKNPYPTKGEKVMLAIITKMSLTQVSTWFANARRRLKKEGKMTWTPRNSYDDDEDDDMDDDDEVTALDDHKLTPPKSNGSQGQVPPKPSQVLRVCVNEDDEGYSDDLFTPKEAQPAHSATSLPLSKPPAPPRPPQQNPQHPQPKPEPQSPLDSAAYPLIKCELPFTRPIANATISSITLSHNPLSKTHTHSRNANSPEPKNDHLQIQSAINGSRTFSESCPDKKSRMENARKKSPGSKFWSLVDTASKPTSESSSEKSSPITPVNSTADATSQ